MAELLLLSNSTAPGRAFLAHALEVIAEVVQGRRRLLFLAQASSDPGRYTTMMRDGLAHIGVQIVDPGSFRALGLIPFQINAHYPHEGPAEPQGGETRQRRIAEFLDENDVPVLGMPEGTWLRVSGPAADIGGVTGCVLFRRGAAVHELPAGSDVSALLGLRAEFDAAGD